MRGSCSVASAIPVHKHDVHITFAVPLHVGQIHLVFDVGSINRPGRLLVEHSAHCKYPLPLQYMQIFLRCSLTF